MRSRTPIDDLPWRGGRISECAWCQLCPNPSPMTLEGTNTWILAEPGSQQSVVIDPGPLEESHLQQILNQVAQLDSRVALTLLTHSHDDHAQSAARFAALTEAPVRAIGSGHDDLSDGDRLDIGGLELLVVATPGHTADSISFLLPREQLLLTGDTLLGRGSTVVAYPDGRLSAYLESLQRLEQMAGSGLLTCLAPGHGPVVADAAATIDFYQAHRQQRLEQVRGTVAEVASQTEVGDLADAVVAKVYADVPREVWPGARLSVLAQLEYLGLVRD